MNLLNTIKLAFSALTANKLRSGLTTLGVIIGIATVVIVLSVGKGAEEFIVNQLQSWGTDIVFTEVKVPSARKSHTESGFAIMSGVTVNTLKESDMEATLRLPNVKNGYAAAMGQEIASYGNEEKRIMLWATNGSFIDIDQSEVAQGRFFTDREDKGLARVAVIGKEIKEKFFPNENPLGKYIKIKKVRFKIIGVIGERGYVGFDMDNLIYIPLQTGQKLLFGYDYIPFFATQIEDEKYANATREDIRFLLRDRHDIDDPLKEDFRVTTMEESMEIMKVVTDGLTLLLIALAAVSLIVGGVGIMNVMYVAVSERTHEIGLRKAIGAKSSTILNQFLLEAVIITFFGALIGIVGGILISYLFSVAINTRGIPWSFIISFNSILLSIASAILFGVVFGLYPARKAAKMNPIEALRYE